MWHKASIFSGGFPAIFGVNPTNLYYNPALGKYCWQGITPLASNYYISSGIGPNVYIKGYPGGTALCEAMPRFVGASWSYYCPSQGLYVYQATGKYAMARYVNLGAGAGSRFWIIAAEPADKLGVAQADIGNKGQLLMSYALDASELGDFWASTSFLTTDDGLAPTIGRNYYYYAKYALNPNNTGWTLPEGYKSVVYDLAGIAVSPLVHNPLGVYSDGTVFGWKLVNQTAGGTPLPAQFTERNTKSNGEYSLKGTAGIVDWFIWFDATNWIISAAVGDKSSFYWQSASLIGAYAYVQNGSPLVYPAATIVFNSYVLGASRETAYIGRASTTTGDATSL
jgi:hypothetical protein